MNRSNGKRKIFDKKLEIGIPNVSNKNNKNNKCYNEDANILIKKHNFYMDIVYIDPPYNSRQYSDAYHLLENVAKWEKPIVYGVAKKMDRTNIKSKYCTNFAKEEFQDLIKILMLNILYYRIIILEVEQMKDLMPKLLMMTY